MAFPFNFLRLFTGGTGRLARMCAVLDEHSRFIEGLRGENIDIDRNVWGSVTLRAAGGQGDNGQWSGIVWFAAEQAWDFSCVYADPSQAKTDWGLFGVEDDGETVTYRGSVKGVYLKISLADGSYAWVDSIDTDLDQFSYYPVAEISGQDSGSQNIYVPLIGRTVGDIRLDVIPYLPEPEPEPEPDP